MGEEQRYIHQAKLGRFLTPVWGNGFQRAPIFPYRSLQASTIPEGELAISGRLASTAAMGDFFEALSAAFYGGKNYSQAVYEDDHLRFDVINPEENIGVESKAVVWGGNGKVTARNDQVNAQRKTQRDNPDALFRAIFYQHTFPGIRSYGGRPHLVHKPAEWLHWRLAEGPLYAVDLDFLVYDILQDSTEEDLVYNYRPTGNRRRRDTDAKRFDFCTSIRGRTLRRLVSEPERVLEQLDTPGDTIVRHYVSPQGLHVDGIPVSQFPILSVDVVDRAAWIAARIPRWERIEQRDREQWLQLAQEEADEDVKSLRDQGMSVDPSLHERLVKKKLPAYLREEVSLEGQIPLLLAPAGDDDLPF